MNLKQLQTEAAHSRISKLSTQKLPPLTSQLTRTPSESSRANHPSAATRFEHSRTPTYLRRGRTGTGATSGGGGGASGDVTSGLSGGSGVSGLGGMDVGMDDVGDNMPIRMNAAALYRELKFYKRREDNIVKEYACHSFLFYYLGALVRFLEFRPIPNLAKSRRWGPAEII